MSQDKRILALIEKISSSSKYIQTKINDTENTYIYHSEQKENTCENCKSLDNIKFYPGDLMIIPPIHPHCNCKIEEITDNTKNHKNLENKKESLTQEQIKSNDNDIKDETSNTKLSGAITKDVTPDYENNLTVNETNEQTNEQSNEQINENITEKTNENQNISPIQETEIENAKKDLESAGKKLDETASIIKETQDTVKKDIEFDFQVLDEQINAIKPGFDIDLSILEDEKENHLPNCNEFNKRINEVKTKKAEFEKIKNDVEDNKKKIEEIKDRLNSAIYMLESYGFDFQFFLEKMQEPWNFDSVAIKEVQDLKQKIHALDCELNQYVKHIKALINSNNKLKEKLTTFVNYSMQAIEQFKCNCASILDKTDKARRAATTDETGKFISIFNPIGGSNIQDAMHDFEYAKRNPNAEVLSAGDEQNGKTINETMEELRIPKGEKTVVYSATSLQSRKLAHTPAIRNYIKTHIKELLKADGKPLKDEVLHHDIIQVDAFVGIQNFTLHNPRVTKDGFFEAVVYDFYDFVHREEKSWVKALAHINPKEIEKDVLLKEANKLNNTGYNMQESGLLQNYHAIYYIYEQLW